MTHLAATLLPAWLPSTLLQAAGGFSDLTWALLLLGAGVVLYIVEAMNPGFFLAIPGTVLLVCGFIMIVDPSLFQQAWSWFAIIAVSALATWGTITMYKRMAPPEMSNTTIGSHNVMGRTGKTDTPVTPEGGTVLIDGEAWRALSRQGSIPKGTPVVVVGLEGALTVLVEPKE